MHIKQKSSVSSTDRIDQLHIFRALSVKTWLRGKVGYVGTDESRYYLNVEKTNKRAGWDENLGRSSGSGMDE